MLVDMISSKNFDGVQDVVSSDFEGVVVGAPGDHGDLFWFGRDALFQQLNRYFSAPSSRIVVKEHCLGTKGAMHMVVEVAPSIVGTLRKAEHALSGVEQQIPDPIELPPLYLSLGFAPSGKCNSLVLHLPNEGSLRGVLKMLKVSCSALNKIVFDQVLQHLNGDPASESVLAPGCVIELYTPACTEEAEQFDLDQRTTGEAWGPEVLSAWRESFPDFCVKGFTDGLPDKAGVIHGRLMFKGTHMRPFVPPAGSQLGSDDGSPVQGSGHVVKLPNVKVELALTSEGEVGLIRIFNGSSSCLHVAAMRTLILYGPSCEEVRRQNLSCLADPVHPERPILEAASAAVSSSGVDFSSRLGKIILETEEDPQILEQIMRRKEPAWNQTQRSASPLGDAGPSESSTVMPKVVCKKGDELYGPKYGIVNPLLCRWMTLDQRTHEVRCKLDPQGGVCQARLADSESDPGPADSR